MRKLAAGVVVLALALAGLAAAATTADTYTYKATLTRAAEVPKPTAPAAAKGAFTATVVEGETGASIRWTLTFRGLSGKVVGAHIHRGKPGVAGAVVVPLCGPCTSGKKGKQTITKAIAAMLESGRAYVNLHTAKNAAGEIRGQVKLTRKTEGSATTDPPAPPPGDSGGEDPPPPPGY